MASNFVCGFECGREASAGPHWYNIAGSNPTFDTTIVRSGSRSIKFLPVFTNSCAARRMAGSSPLSAGTVSVYRFYVYFTVMPTADTFIMWVGSSSATRIGVAYKQSDGKIYPAHSNITFGTSGIPITTGQWYRVDAKLDFTAGAKVIDVQVNGVSCDQLTASTGASSAYVQIGFSESQTGSTMYFDDFESSDTGGDYPIGDGWVDHFIPTADGTHSITASGQFERGNDTGDFITNAYTTAYTLVDEVPIDDITPNTDDYIAALDPADADDYVEVVFGPAPGVTTPTLGPSSVEVIVLTHQLGTGTGNTRLALNDNGSLDNVVNHTRAGDPSIRYDRKNYSDPPSAATAWGVTSGNGNFLNLRMRFYSSDANPVQFWDGVMIEAAFPGVIGEGGGDVGGYYACAGTLPTFITADQDKIDELRALRAAGSPIGQAFELVKISWPSPTDPVYYAVLQVDEAATVAPPVTPIETRLLADDDPAWFLPVQIDHSIGDEEVDLAFWDGDGAFSDLLVDHGEGIKVELFYWFPLVELLLPVWHGHLRQEDDAEIDICKVKAVQGFRASESLLPRRAHWKECQAIFGAVFDTQEEIDQNDCPYNKHIGGSVGNFISGSTPYTSCPRRTRDDCIARLGNNGNYMLSHATISTVVPNNQSKGGRLYSTSQGNETNLKDPVPVVMGQRRVHDMPVIAFRKDLNNNDPDHGWYFAQYESCEGPVEAILYPEITVGGKTQQAVPLHYNHRLGTQGQTPVNTDLTPHSYSSTALIHYGFGWVNPEDIDTADASASAVIQGLNNIRVYTDETTYTEEYTTNRAWQIMRMLTDKRWGYGYDYDRLDIPSFIEAACWCSNVVRFTDANGDTWDHIRARSDVELRGRKVQDQIEDMCMAGRLSRPFLFNGKIHILPLRVMTAAELAAAPVFTEEGDAPNIVQEEVEEGVFRSLMKVSRISDLELPNRIECTFDDSTDNYLEKPLRPVEDIDAQLAAGRVIGDFSRKINTKKYGLTGVTIEGHGLKLATSLLDLGPFDEGGLQNNLRLKFPIWFLDSLDLYPTRVIKVESTRLTKYGFDYFRVVDMKRRSDLIVDLTVQAYNETYMATFEELYGDLDTLPDDPPDPDTGTAVQPTDPLVFGTISYSNGVIQIENFAS